MTTITTLRGNRYDTDSGTRFLAEDHGVLVLEAHRGEYDTAALAGDPFSPCESHWSGPFWYGLRREATHRVLECTATYDTQAEADRALGVALDWLSARPINR